MKNFILALCVSLATAALAVGQTNSSDDYKKVEGYVGYSNGQVDTGADSGSSVNDFFRDRRKFNGVNVAGVYNFSRFVGVKGDISATFNSERFTSNVGGTAPYTVSVRAKNQLWNFVGGVQVKDNERGGVFKPFAHAMVGLGRVQSKITDFACSPSAACPVLTSDDNSFSENGFSGVFGGGVDFRVSDRFQIRAIQVDYNPVRVFGQWNNNLRLGAGIVF